MAALLPAGAAGASEIFARVEPDRPAEFEIPARVSDDDLADPTGYFPAARRPRSLMKRLTIANRGGAPASPELIVNGASLFSWAGLRRTTRLEAPGDYRRFFRLWCDARQHATSGAKANRHPIHVLRSYGFTFCGDDARAVGAAMTWLGAEARFARLNGHSAVEFRVGGRWILLDGDQQLVYYHLDNASIASAQEVTDDPFLALRTRVYGRQSGWDGARSWLNASRFERIDAGEPRPLRTKFGPEPAPFYLLRGERIVIHYDRAPEFGAASWHRDTALSHALVEIHLDPAARSRQGTAIFSPYALVAGAKADCFEIAAPITGPVAAFASLKGLPHFRGGRNTIELPAGAAPLDIVVETDDSTTALDPTPSPAIAAPTLFDHVAPRFGIEAAGDRIWWQIALDESFLDVPPNLERVEDRATEVVIDSAVSATFLSPGRTYFFRAKVRDHGVWSSWSAAHRFEIAKPPQPEISGVERIGDAIRIRWRPTAGEMLVFGSDRLDFLPEPFSPTEPSRIEDGAITESRPNRNLLARVPSARGEAVLPPNAFLRLIGADRSALSVPSRLVRTGVSRGAVLQCRHARQPGELVGRDVATVVPLPVSSAAESGGRAPSQLR